ncbi:prepilin-type N-terminal cleavage/methylation domain-containing protein [Burkholderia cenocepacia]|uniref:prepilin-type N-terminal cleavage/methylation domain-containing protein n=1 Tax=Burkholderia cenocepacia TaxID=95486 RepID=UPI001F39F337|nr:prepilin-type N-terminal cleavage/methylation domain-containing protein [Burkholderia cenocepacia]UJH74039.1 prepilin-type N-terminal cleavage/methylation domain-containing protein [Burkholderia cenocepacia]
MERDAQPLKHVLQRPGGFTLVELMVAMSLAVVDMAPPPALSDALAHAPPDGDGSPVSYELTATPLDTGPMRDDARGTFTLRSNGTKGNAGIDGADEPGAGACAEFARKARSGAWPCARDADDQSFCASSPRSSRDCFQIR